MNLYPRSFLRLVVVGNVVVMLPLVAALGYSAWTAEDLARRGQEVVSQASTAGKFGHELPEDLEHLDRILRQYEVLHDASLLDEYAAARDEWRHDVAAYAAIPLLAGLSPRILDACRVEDAAFSGMRAGGVAQNRQALAAVRRDLQPLLDEANRVVEAERQTFRSRSEDLWQRLLAAVATAAAATVMLLLYGRRLVARLWSRFERAVLALGEGRLDRSIRLRGPEDLQRVGRRLEWLRRRMVRLEDERTRVLRHVSHELKTPLAALREGTSLLKEGVAGPLTQQQEKIAAIMQFNTTRLQELIDALLRMQQASHARDQMQTSAVRLDRVIEQALATYQLAARDRLVRVSGELAPLTVEGGSEALTTLAGNLISNAIKFSPDGGMVRVTLRQEEDNAVLDVMDEGPGVAADERDRLFEPFFRGSAGKSAPGIGLGLAIAHEFALAHRGRLEVMKTARGAHFRARLPLTGK